MRILSLTSAAALALVVFTGASCEAKDRSKKHGDGPADTPAATAAAPTGPGIAKGNPREMKVLVIGATTSEPAWGAVTTSLERIGVPYGTLVASTTTLTADFLSAPGSALGNYYGVILTSGNLAWESSPGVWESAFTDAEWALLAGYEREYGVRQVTFYTYPGGWPDTFGLLFDGTADTSATPLYAHVTAAGQAVFPYIQPNAQIPVRYAWTYLGTPESASVTSVVETADGHSLAAIKTYDDGRQNLAFTMDQAYWLQHTMLFAYGAVNWVTGGVFLGERHVYLSAESDDYLIPDDMWDTQLLTDQSGLEFRLTQRDMSATLAWLTAFRKKPNFGEFSFEYAFNGSGAGTRDALTKWTAKHQAAFGWINHTWDHENLDATSYAETTSQLTQNIQLARRLRLKNFSLEALVQPDVSGLDNAAAMQAAYDAGVRYVVSDTSKVPGFAFSAPSPHNTGTPNALVPGILEVPRRPTNIFYNTSTPAELVSEYNRLYHAFWGRDLTYAEILDVESDNYLGYMLAFDIYPLMFHQPNSRAYDGKHALMNDAFDRVAAKYGALCNLPVQSLSLVEIGRRMQQRAAVNASGARAFLFPGSQIVIDATAAATIPVTGVISGGTTESYGGQPISWVPVQAGASVVIPLQ